MTPTISEYRYVDVWSIRDGRAQKWKRYLDNGSNYKKWLSDHEGCDCFKTTQLFKNPSKLEGELSYGPLGFDLDSEDLNHAKNDLSKLYSWAIETQNIEHDDLEIYFSGSKGFHMLILPDAIGIEPRPDNHLIFKEIASYLRDAMDIQSLDLKVYQSRHVWRIPGTRHTKTGLYKTRLGDGDIALSIEEIKDMSREPYNDEFSGQFRTVRDSIASEIYVRIVERRKFRRDYSRTQPRSSVLSDEDGTPDCINDIERNFFRVPGDRHRANFFLATYYRDSGLSGYAAESRLIDWASGIPNTLSKSSQSERIALAKSTIRSTFAADYHFECNAIRSLGTADDAVSCPGEQNCPFIKYEELTKTRTVKVSLEEALEPKFHVDKGIEIEMDCYLAGREDEPTSIPLTSEINCFTEDRCKACPYKDGEPIRVELSERDPRILMMMGKNTKEIHSIIRGIAGIPKKNNRPCISAIVTERENKNIWHCMLQPHVEFHGDDHEISYRRNRTYIVSRDVRANNRYTVRGVSVPDPYSRKVVHVIDKVSGLRTASRSWSFDEEIHKNLSKTFNGAPDKLFDDIHNVLEQHCHGIYSRKLYSIACDIVVHSILHLHWEGKLVKRGWLEAAVIGDTDQGKTTLLRRLFDYYGIGQIISMEGTTEPGLVGAAVRYGDVWMVEFGALCRNDEGIVALDECQNSPDGLLPKLNSVREDGKVTIEKAGRGESAARCRKLFLSNPPFNRSLDEFSYGVESVRGIFKSEGSIRRFDFALCLRRSEKITKEIYKSHDVTVENKYPPSLCRMLIQWAWSRQPKHLEWGAGTEEAINEAALGMLARYAESGIPLVSSGSQALKVARVSASVAARCYSTPDGRALHVLPEHVDYAVSILDMMYVAPDMNYAGWSDMMKKLNILSDDEYKEVHKKLTSCLTSNAKAFIKYIHDTEFFNKQQMTTEWVSSGISDVIKKDKVVELISVFKQAHLIERKAGRPEYRKTAKGITAIRKMMEDGYGSISIKEEIEDLMGNIDDLDWGDLDVGYKQD